MHAGQSFDVAALAAHLVARDTGGQVTIDTLARIGVEAILPYYARAYAIMAAARDQPRQ